MTNFIQAVRGMNDILPEQTPAWQHIEAELRRMLQCYGYAEIRLPLLENTALFKRSVGEVTDIVEKELYTFVDRNGDSLSLRPEGTAGCVRACLQHSLLHNQTQRLWYYGAMYRHERPQKGRYRQFYQLGVEALGFSGPDIDVELILMGARLWRALGLEQVIQLQLNTLGTPAEREEHRKALIAYLEQHMDKLDAHSQERVYKNPLRIFDSKNKELDTIINSAPQLTDFLGVASKQFFEQLCAQLEQHHINFSINPRLVRGLDYYTHTVFEWVTDKLGAQSAVCAGGRYDYLVEQLGGKACPAVGFALGIERILLLYKEYSQRIRPEKGVDIYAVFLSEAAQASGTQWIEKIRDHLPQLSLISHCGGGGLKSQFKKADKSGAAIALIFDDQVMHKQTVSIKFLRSQRPQEEVMCSELQDFLKRFFYE